MHSNVFNFYWFVIRTECFNYQYALIDCNITVKWMIVYGFIKNLHASWVLSKCWVGIYCKYSMEKCSFSWILYIFWNEHKKCHAEKYQLGFYGFARKHSLYLHSNTFIIVTRIFQIQPHFDTLLITTQFDRVSFAFHWKVFAVNATKCAFFLHSPHFPAPKVSDLWTPFTCISREACVIRSCFGFFPPSNDGVTSCHSISSLK